MLTWEWGAYLGNDALTNGVDVRIASWPRSAPNTFPTLAKTSANYANSQLIKMEAIVEGYSEGIALDTFGYLSEGSGQNLFVVREGCIYTPPLTASILPGITRNSVITIARDLGYKVREEMLPRELLYICDEAFFAGTAVEITPIRSVDKVQIGSGKTRSDHRGAPAGVLRHHQGRDSRSPQLADVRLPWRAAAAGRRRFSQEQRAAAIDSCQLPASSCQLQPARSSELKAGSWKLAAWKLPLTACISTSFFRSP